jgi:hypothetical protein
MTFLYKSSTWHASDPRDKIFAITGIAEEMGDLEISQQLAPDYSKSVLDLYRAAACQLRIHDNSRRNAKIKVLSAVQHFPDISDEAFPSWVPLWDQQYRMSTLTLGFAAGSWSASGKSKPCITLPENASSILISGFPFYRVRCVDGRLRQVYGSLSTPIDYAQPIADAISAFREIWNERGSICTAYRK